MAEDRAPPMRIWLPPSWADLSRIYVQTFSPPLIPPGSSPFYLFHCLKLLEVSCSGKKEISVFAAC